MRLGRGTPVAGATAAAVQGVRVRGLVRRFGANTVIDGLDLEVPAGQFVCLLGRSGCGKTTLLRTIAGLEAAQGGSVQAPAQKSVVFQEPRLLPWRSVAFNVRFGAPRAPDAAARAEATLREVGLGQHLQAWPLTLSGGQAQRVALARALVRQPGLLLLDEPFAALDALTRLQMQALVQQLCRAHRPATILVTHDVTEAIRLGDRILVMRDGAIAVDIATQPLHEAPDYDKAFMALQKRLLSYLNVHAPEPEHQATPEKNP